MDTKTAIDLIVIGFPAFFVGLVAGLWLAAEIMKQIKLDREHGIDGDDVMEDLRDPEPGGGLQS